MPVNNDIGNYCIKVQPRYVVAYYQSLPGFAHHRKSVNSYFAPDDAAASWKNNFKSNLRKKDISKTSIKKIKLAVDYMVYLAKPKKIYNFKTKTYFTFKLNFFTATLSSQQIHTDLEIKRDILRPFLDFLRKKYKISRYVWRLEKQANGSSHFHLILDKYIPWWVLREHWNYYQGLLGYIDRYRENQLSWHLNGFRPRPELFKTWPLESQRKAYITGRSNDWRDPNSTDIHSIQKIKDVSAYISKYITKNPEIKNDDSNCEGRIWAVSESLGNLSPNSVDWDSLVGSEILELSKNKLCHTIDSQYFTVFYIPSYYLKRIGCYTLHSMFTEWITQKFPEG